MLEINLLSFIIDVNTSTQITMRRKVKLPVEPTSGMGLTGIYDTITNNPASGEADDTIEGVIIDTKTGTVYCILEENHVAGETELGNCLADYEGWDKIDVRILEEDEDTEE